LEKVKSVLKTVDKAALEGWPTNGKPPNLPEWFTSGCASEMSDEQARKWLSWWKSLSPEEQARTEIEKDWSLVNWLSWMEPNNREWFWWEAKVLGDYVIGFSSSGIGWFRKYLCHCYALALAIGYLLRIFLASYFWPNWRRKVFRSLTTLASYFVAE